LQDDAAAGGSGSRDSREERLGVGVVGGREDLVCGAGFDDAAEVHDDDVVGDGAGQARA